MIDTALEVIAEHGYAGMSLQMVASATGVTKAAVYYHFRTKSQLLDAILQQLFADAPEAKAPVPGAAPTLRSRRSRLTWAAETMLEALTQSRRALSVINADPVIRRHPSFLTLVRDTRERTLTSVYGEHPTTQEQASFYLATSAVHVLPNLEHLSDGDLVQALRPPLYRALGLPAPTCSPTRPRGHPA